MHDNKDMGTQYRLEVEKIDKSYGEKKVLDQISLAFHNGLYGLLGPNGAGKSTLISIITSYRKADAGRIRYCGRDVDAQKDEHYRSVIGYMPQYPVLYEDFSLYDYLDYIAALKGIKKKEVRGEILRVSKLVHLENHLSQKIGSFSGGMKQRAMLAQALLGDPEILILDEPSAGLDPKERVRLRNIIGDLAKNRTVILATHIMSDIEKIAEYVILIKAGKIIAQDTPENLTHMIQTQSGKECNNLEDIYLYYFGDVEDEDNSIS